MTKIEIVNELPIATRGGRTGEVQAALKEFYETGNKYGKVPDVDPEKLDSKASTYANAIKTLGLSMKVRRRGEELYLERTDNGDTKAA